MKLIKVGNAINEIKAKTTKAYNFVFELDKD